MISREEGRIHIKLGGMQSQYPTKEDLVKAYGPLLVENIVSKHTLAKNHFAKMASMSKFFEDMDDDKNGQLSLKGHRLSTGTHRQSTGTLRLSSGTRPSTAY